MHSSNGNGEQVGTVKQMADRVRELGGWASGEAIFARMCLELDRRLNDGGVGPSEASIYRVAALFRLLAANEIDARLWQLAMVWLDGHGYGTMSLTQFGLEVKRVREIAA